MEFFVREVPVVLYHPADIKGKGPVPRLEKAYFLWGEQWTKRDWSEVGAPEVKPGARFGVTYTYLFFLSSLWIAGAVAHENR